jgi:hypothetical protein
MNFMLSKTPIRRLPFAEFTLPRLFREGQAAIWDACKLGA